MKTDTFPPNLEIGDREGNVNFIEIYFAAKSKIFRNQTEGCNGDYLVV